MGATILIAEDEANIVESLSFILRREGHLVSCVDNGDTALARMRGLHPPALLILDVMLPQRNGYEVLKALKADQRTCHIPVLMLTAKTQALDREQAEQLGVNAYMTKPFSNREVVDQVRRLTGG